MVKLSEIHSGDGSFGGDPNKNPQEEEENQNKQPQQLVLLDRPIDLPYDIAEYIVTLLDRCDYPNLSCMSRTFRRVIGSNALFEIRSRLGRTERFLYALIGCPPLWLPRWFILYRRNNSLRLSLIDSLPPLYYGSAVVTIGHKIYIIGGCLVPFEPLKIVIAIDCRFHTFRYLPSMRRARIYAAAGEVDGKIYVIGGCMKQGRYWIEVFDVSSETWGTVPCHKYPTDASFDGCFDAHVVMENKIYILDRWRCLVYEPRKHRWESWGVENQRRWYWHRSSCMIDDMLYTIDPWSFLGYPIVVYDPKDVVWRPVKGVRMSDLLSLAYLESRMANFGGKLVILGRGQNSYGWDSMDRDIWCIVIALERHEDGEIWGIVESRSHLLSFFMWPFIDHFRTVTV